MSKATNTQIKIYWPKIFKKDRQSKFMSYTYNEDENATFYVSILWASTLPASSPEFTSKPFKSARGLFKEFPG